jgi:hypothetical protein
MQPSDWQFPEDERRILLCLDSLISKKTNVRILLPEPILSNMTQKFQGALVSNPMDFPAHKDRWCNRGNVPKHVPGRPSIRKQGSTDMSVGLCNVYGCHFMRTGMKVSGTEIIKRTIKTT